MIRSLLLTFAILVIVSCNNSTKEPEKKPSDLIIMTPGGLNDAKLTDTLVIYENVCRGCAYEKSTHFEVVDSNELVRVSKIETIDNTPPDTDGGSIDKHIYLVPVKAGSTKIKLYKFDNDNPTAEDSATFTTYAIQIKE